MAKRQSKAAQVINFFETADISLASEILDISRVKLKLRQHNATVPAQLQQTPKQRKKRSPNKSKSSVTIPDNAGDLANSALTPKSS